MPLGPPSWRSAFVRYVGRRLSTAGTAPGCAEGGGTERRMGGTPD
ncbi:hypothetical protein QRN89_16230 [Streptomyces chengbuensis]|nr:hypothetical protein [Streptomyces sp. HUAS CB01]WJY51222.1 hypothetical protein QRN89_16230 [Streptomyces sp. HUAS CB01]